MPSALVVEAYNEQLVILTYHQYATLMSPNKGKTGVCGFPPLYRMTGGKQSLVAI